ncbi:MAG: tetratricopeptide repeat protein [Acidobacteriota bacterium]
MKRCPECRRDYADDLLLYCLEDGTQLVQGSVPLVSDDGPATAILSEPPALAGGTTASESPTRAQIHTNDQTAILPAGSDAESQASLGDVSERRRRSANQTSKPRVNTDGENRAATPLSERSKLLAGLGVLAIILIAGVFGYRYFKTAPTEQINSIAVLPFQNKSGDPTADYLSDGLAESLIYRLSQLPNLKVSPTSSVIRYKGKDTEVAKIADELGVDAVMTGRLAQIGDNLTISVELVDVRNNKLLWGEKYERKMSELLATQREIATEITNNLKLKLSGEGGQKLAKKYTDNNEAYQLYLKGNYHYAKRTKGDILKGIEYFEQAIQLDPNFALAYVAISESYATMPAYPYLSPNEAFPKAKSAAQKALEIDPSLAEAHTVLGFSLAAFDWNWVEAEREFKRAIELNPNLSFAHFRYGWTYLSPVGRSDEAITEMNRALELEPLSLVTGACFSQVYVYARQSDRAVQQATKIYDLDPTFVTGRVFLAHSYNSKGMYTEAITLSQESLRKDPTSQFFLWAAGNAFARSGQRREAEDVIKKFKDIAKTQYISSYFVATIHAGLDERDKAFTELEKAYSGHDWYMSRLKVDPLVDSLRGDPRFKDLLKRLNLPE